MGRILGIDYGQKRIGIAVTDPLKITASGLTSLKPHEIFSFLTDYFRREEVECVVLGYPLRMNNEPSDALKYVLQFEKAFRRKYPEVKLVLEDERFTSKLAVQAMVQGGMKKKERRKKETIDKISAAIILQSYLEGQQR